MDNANEASMSSGTVEIPSQHSTHQPTHNPTHKPTEVTPKSDPNIIPAVFRPWPAYWQSLPREMEWLRHLLTARIDSYFNDQHFDFNEMPPPEFTATVIPENNEDTCYYARLITQQSFTSIERLLVMLAWVAEYAPHELDILQTRNKLYELPYAEFGGLHNQNHGGFYPTLQTALFLIAGSDQVALLSAQRYLATESRVFSGQILMWDDDADTLPLHQGLRLSEATRYSLLQGSAKALGYSAQFPAHQLDTPYEWDDLILPQTTAKHLTELRLWLKHADALRHDWAMHKALPKGYKALFYGPPGTGKTLTAALLGKVLNKPVYRIDLSQVVSKYIGETEKNLERIFLKAEQNNWILFFDEADALFGKRTQVSSSNDRNANMETGYLLQRIESCPNLVILASNLKDNIDEAFLRRFQSIIHFTNPDIKERLVLWQKGFSEKANVSQINFAALAKEYVLSGAEINNCIRYASLMALEHHGGIIDGSDIVSAIRREKFKSGQFV